jgi:hypothetical protein
LREYLVPYYIYTITPPKRLELVDSFDGYRDARTRARALRAALEADTDRTVRVIFAHNTDEATRLLMEVREPRALGEE